MSTEQKLHDRSGSRCELCGVTDHLLVYNVPPQSGDDTDKCILACGTCFEQINDPESIDPNHWRCLNESMWSQVPAVQVMAWRMLKKLSSEGWPQDLLDMLYLDEELLAWAQATAVDNDEEVSASHKDSNGIVLEAGDTVILIKDLNVKGAGFTAKRGTAVRGISLVPDTPSHIEGRVNGQQIVILTQFVKKST